MHRPGASRWEACLTEQQPAEDLVLKLWARPVRCHLHLEASLVLQLDSAVHECREGWRQGQGGQVGWPQPLHCGCQLAAIRGDIRWGTGQVR